MVKPTSYICCKTLENLHDATDSIFYEILAIYIKDADNMINAMMEEFKKDNTAEILRLAHTLKGSSQNVGAIRTAELCASLENFTSNTSSNMEIHIKLIRTSYSKSLPLLKEYLKG